MAFFLSRIGYNIRNQGWTKEGQMHLEEVRELPICRVTYRDLCQHEKDIHDIQTSDCKILEIFGRTIIEPDANDNIKVVSTLDLDDGGDSSWLVIPETDVIRITSLEEGKILYEKKAKTKKKSKYRRKKKS